MVQYIRLLGIFGYMTLSTVVAWAQCPDGDPCETIDVYRIQTWPNLLSDAKGRSLLSLTEANALNDAAFSPAIKSMGNSTALAIRYTVSRIADKPQDYCECNLEYEGKGCAVGKIAVEQLKLCSRECRRGDAACRGSGYIDKPDNGRWYGFPASTEWSDNGIWKKNAFDVKAENRDWIERSELREVKRADCISENLEADSTNLASLFDDEEICPSVSNEALTNEALK